MMAIHYFLRNSAVSLLLLCNSYIGLCRLFAQPSAAPALSTILELDLEKRAVIFVCNIKSDEERENISTYVRNELGDHLNDLFGILYDEPSLDTYNTLCTMNGLFADKNNTMLVLYFNKRAVQFPFDLQIPRLLAEFKKLGWLPLKDRLEEFLKINPYNQEALGVWFALKKQELDFSDNPPSEFIKAIKTVNKTESLDWLDSIPVIVTLTSTTSKGLDKYSVLKNDTEFQRELIKLLELIEDKIIKNPFLSPLYHHWSFFSDMAKEPNPRRILSQVRFPPGNQPVSTDFSILARTFFRNDRVTEGFQVLTEIEQWMQNQDVVAGTNLNQAFSYFAKTKIAYLIKYEHFVETEKYLNELIFKFASEWTRFAENIYSGVSRILMDEDIDIEKIPNFNRVKYLFDSPPLQRIKHYSGLLLSHNFSKDFFNKLTLLFSQKKLNVYCTQDVQLQQNSWTLKNANILVESGIITLSGTEESDTILKGAKDLLDLIHREERAYLNSLEIFIRQNPENQIAMRFFCLEAQKYLPDEALERKMYSFTQVHCIALSAETYSKFENKNLWSQLASRMITDGLIKLKDNPVGYSTNPWRSLSGWENLDIAGNGNGIDWYVFFQETEFWYDPMYYVQAYVMPESVFIKLLNQTERARDWKFIFDACVARYNKKNRCKNERVLALWKRAEEGLSN